MSPLLITALEFGPETPQIRSVSAPQLDARGVWVDLQVTYDGRVTMTLTTQLNLMYLKGKSKMTFYNNYEILAKHFINVYVYFSRRHPK